MSTATDTRTYSSVEAAKLIGCTYRQLDFWIRKGAIAASVKGACGSGSRRRYSESDIIAGRVAMALIESTTTAAVDRAGRALPALMDLLASDAPPAGIYVTADGRLSVEPVTGTYIALVDLLEHPASGGSGEDPPPRPATGARYCRGCGDPSPWEYCSPECASSDL